MALMQVPITKGKANIEIDTDSIPEDVYAEALLQGLKVLLNRGASKITKEAYPNETEMKAAAMAKAEEQLKLVQTSKIKFSGKSAAKKASGAVMTEARRLARNLIKDAMKAEGIKVSHVEASEITKAANALLEDKEQGAKLIAQAEANIAERSEVKVTTGLVQSIKISDKKVAAAADKAAKAKAAKASAPLSATQAGKTATRQKGQKAQPTA